MAERKLVRDLMAVGVPTCSTDTPIVELVRKMLEEDWEAVVVLEGEQGHAVGVIERQDLVGAYARGEFASLHAEEVMRDDVPSVPPEIPLAAAAQIMQDQGVHALFLTHHAGGIEYPAAWLTYKHLLRHMAGDNLDDLGIRAARENPLDVFIRRRDEARRRAGGRHQA